jgi:hypothetical protein
MQRRAEGIGGEEGFPKTRRQFVRTAGRMLTDALQDIDVFSPEFVPTEHPGFPTHGNCP